MSLPGFEPGLHGQNAIHLPLAPTPLPCQNWSVRNIFIGKGSIERSALSIVRSKSEMDWTILTEMFRKRSEFSVPTKRVSETSAHAPKKIGSRESCRRENLNETSFQGKKKIKKPSAEKRVEWPNFEFANWHKGPIGRESTDGSKWPLIEELIGQKVSDWLRVLGRWWDAYFESLHKPGCRLIESTWKMVEVSILNPT